MSENLVDGGIQLKAGQSGRKGVGYQQTMEKLFSIFSRPLLYLLDWVGEGVAGKGSNDPWLHNADVALSYRATHRKYRVESSHRRLTSVFDLTGR
jgi:hypothetical protein